MVKPHEPHEPPAPHLDPRLRRLLPKPLSPEHEAALCAALIADGPLEPTAEYAAWLAECERLRPGLEAALAAEHARFQRQGPPPLGRRPRRRPSRPPQSPPTTERPPMPPTA